MTNVLALRVAALLGFLAIALGALGAHGLNNLLERNQTTAIWEKAVFYQFIHVVMLFVLAAAAVRGPSSGAGSEDAGGPAGPLPAERTAGGSKASALEWWGRGPWWCFLVGVLVFSGSLYLLAVTNARWLGAITPVGGASFLAGWLWLALEKAKG